MKAMRFWIESDEAHLAVAVEDTATCDGEPMPAGSTVEHIVSTPLLDGDGVEKGDVQLQAELAALAKERVAAADAAPVAIERKWTRSLE